MSEEATAAPGLEARLTSEEPAVQPVDERSRAKKIADLYFAPKGFERNGTLYKALGIKTWQKIVMGTVGRAFRKIGMDEYAGQYFIGKRADAEAITTYEKGTRISELIHAPQIIWNGTELANKLGEGDYGGAAFWGSLLLLNTYCTVLQRYNRERVYRVKDRFEKRDL